MFVQIFFLGTLYEVLSLQKYTGTDNELGRTVYHRQFVKKSS